MRSNKKKALISVVLPVYNVENYILKSINSILEQTIQDFEILIIDDCSTDSTLSIVESISDERIVIIKKEKNKGLVDSLNLGFEKSNGIYIARIDGDDYAHPKRFEKQLEILKNNKDIDACGCWLQLFEGSSKIRKYKQTHKEIQAELLLCTSMSMCSVMLVKASFTKYKFDKNKLHVEDYDFWVRSAWQCKFYNIQEVLHYYRIHENQVSTKYELIQREGDVSIKLSMFHKINYDRSVYSDTFIRKVLFSNESLGIEEYKLFFRWLRVLIKLNTIFDQAEFVKVVLQIRRRFVFETIFTSNRKGLDYNFRKNIFLVLPIKEQLFVVRKKIREKIKIIKN